MTGSAGGIGQAYAEALAARRRLGGGGRHRRGPAPRPWPRASGRPAARPSVWPSTWPIPDVGPGHGRRPPSTEFGGIDYLVNNAAIFGGMKLDLLLTVDWEYLNRFLSVNLLGRPQLRPGLLPGHEGAGRRGHREPVVDRRLPLRRLLRTGQGRGQLAHPAAGPRARAATHIRINAIAPGPIDTEASRTVVPDAFMQPILAGLALKRQGETVGPGGHVPVPAVRRGLVDHRPRLQRRRGPGGPPVTADAGRPVRPTTTGSSSNSDQVRLIAFDRPEARNAFDAAMYRAVTGALAGALGDDDVHAVVLTGRGTAFTAGPGPPRDGGHRHRRGRPRCRHRVPGPARRRWWRSTSRCWPRSTAWAWGSAARSSATSTWC